MYVNLIGHSSLIKDYINIKGYKYEKYNKKKKSNK